MAKVVVPSNICRRCSLSIGGSSCLGIEDCEDSSGGSVLDEAADVIVLRLRFKSEKVAGGRVALEEAAAVVGPDVAEDVWGTSPV